jgi:hypothetical protein
MNDDWRAFRPVVIIAALLASALAVLWLLVARDMTALIVPTPEKTSELFFGDLNAHDFESARSALATDLQAATDAETLMAMTKQMEDTGRGILDASGLSAREHDDSAQAEVEVTLAGGEKQVVMVPLRQEQGLWKITSLDPLLALVGG